MTETEQGLVVRSTAGFVDVSVDDEIVRCRIRGRLKNVDRRTDICVIGDQVRIARPDPNTAVVVEVLPRTTRFSRRQPGRGPDREDVLVANLDQLLVTFSYGRPTLKTRLLDRFLVIAEHQNVAPIIVVNKADLKVSRDTDWQPTYVALGYDVVEVSADTGAGLDTLRSTLDGKISAFVGPSGVGKSSLINRILPELSLGTAEVSAAHGKGRHTTRVASLHPLPRGGYLADTPGIRELGTWALPIEDLDLCFPELRDLRTECAFRRCTHTHEPGCAVLDAVRRGAVDLGRYQSYVSLREEGAS